MEPCNLKACLEPEVFAKFWIPLLNCKLFFIKVSRNEAVISGPLFDPVEKISLMWLWNSTKLYYFEADTISSTYNPELPIKIGKVRLDI